MARGLGKHLGIVLCCLQHWPSPSTPTVSYVSFAAAAVKEKAGLQQLRIQFSR